MAKYMDYESWEIIKKNMINMIHPIGSVITNSLSSFDPNIEYPNTKWVRVKGKVIVGVDENDVDFKNGVIGGVKSFNNAHTHTISHHHTIGHNHTIPAHTHSTNAVALTVAQIPSHGHGMRIHRSGEESSGYGLTSTAGFQNRPIVWKTGSIAAWVSDKVGSGQTHSHGTTGSTTLTTDSPSSSTSGGPSNSSSGSAQSTQSLLQPYITKYVWERIS